uniref:Patatin-like phospholipase domain-containing protein 7 n=1 Tax=Zeugodacus cucurbitae TaxID=28588 RepID=A0A0A1X0G6_ZEUCU
MIYTSELYPVCLNVSQLNPESELTGFNGRIQIVAETKCVDKSSNSLQPSQICAKNSEYPCSYAGEPIFVEEKTYAKYQLFGIGAKWTCDYEPIVITKLFEQLKFIENIVWPNSGN